MEFNTVKQLNKKVSKFTLGCPSASRDVRQVDIAATTKRLQAAWDHGINTFDVSELYADGNCAIAMAGAIQSLDLKREDYVLVASVFSGTIGGSTEESLSEQVNKQLHTLLRNLRVHYIDILFVRPPDSKTSVEEVVKIMSRFVQETNLRCWGTSGWSKSDIKTAHEYAKNDNLKSPILDRREYNMIWQNQVEEEYKNVYPDYKMGLAVSFPLYHAILTGKHDDRISGNSSFASEDEITTILGKVSEIAKKLKCTMSQVALAWILKNKHVSTIILKPSNARLIEKYVESLRFVDQLTPEIMKEIDNARKSAQEVPIETFSKFNVLQ